MSLLRRTWMPLRKAISKTLSIGTIASDSKTLLE